jgi:hypothetical protein
MTDHLPSGFANVAKGKERIGTQVSMIGIVADFLPPRRTGGTGKSASYDTTFTQYPNVGLDFQSTIKITDASMSNFTEYATLKFFRPEENQHPSLVEIGDIIVVLKMKVALVCPLQINPS